ncbi:MAG: ATP-binding cassette domain-containing protein [Thermaerobacter sp.]|nr:ATP-binding cassette domain-containing protein [Thermaerobacter sp.]
MLAVQTERLAKVFERRKGRQRQSHLAVDSVDLAIDQGEAVAFIGPNGAGKSTTIKMLTGILHPSAGSAEVLGLVPWKSRQRLALQIGTVFGQRSQLWFHLPAGDTLRLLAAIYDLPGPLAKSRTAELVERFALQDLLSVPVRKLSLGQRMRFEIAASLLHKPKVLFLDEPTVGLDVIAKAEVREVVREANRDGATIFLTSHDAGDIESIARRAIVIDRGRIVFDDKVSQLRRQWLTDKVVELRSEEEVEPPDIPGVHVEKVSRYGLRLRFSAQDLPVRQVIGQLLERYPVHDITISDPPLESVIAAIYQGQAVPK